MFGGAPGSVKDKDGIAAAVVFAEMAADLQQWGIGVAQHLESLKELYGFFETRASYFTSDKPADIRAVFARLRQDGNYPKVRHMTSANLHKNGVSWNTWMKHRCHTSITCTSPPCVHNIVAHTDCQIIASAAVFIWCVCLGSGRGGSDSSAGSGQWNGHR